MGESPAVHTLGSMTREKDRHGDSRQQRCGDRPDWAGRKAAACWAELGAWSSGLEAWGGGSTRCCLSLAVMQSRSPCPEFCHLPTLGTHGSADVQGPGHTRVHPDRCPDPAPGPPGKPPPSCHSGREVCVPTTEPLGPQPWPCMATGWGLSHLYPLPAVAEATRRG